MHAAIVKDILPHFDPTLRIAQYDEFLRLEIACLVGKASPADLLEEARELGSTLHRIAKCVDLLKESTASFVEKLNAIAPIAAGDSLTDTIPGELILFACDHGTRLGKRNPADFRQNLVDYLLPHFIPELYAERFSPYIQFMTLRLQMFVEKRPAHLVLADARKLDSLTKDLQEQSPSDTDRCRSCDIVINKLDGFIAELEDHLKGPSGHIRT
ncbi:MAG: hypothetical protein Q8K78_17800 [Planctomycetaceae bacterium]|nr:hypothetical protein [Planctomycetaceae bacterium]